MTNSNKKAHLVAIRDIRRECVKNNKVKSVQNSTKCLLSERETIALINSDEAEMLHNAYFS